MILLPCRLSSCWAVLQSVTSTLALGASWVWGSVGHAAVILKAPRYQPHTRYPCDMYGQHLVSARCCSPKWRLASYLRPLNEMIPLDLSMLPPDCNTFQLGGTIFKNSHVLGFSISCLEESTVMVAGEHSRKSFCVGLKGNGPCQACRGGAWDPRFAGCAQGATAARCHQGPWSVMC